MFIQRAAAGFFAVALLLAIPASASVQVEGVPKWLASTIAGPMQAVWDETSRIHGPGNREKMLDIVIRRLFPGISIKEINFSGDDLLLILSFDGRSMERWKISLQTPDLSPDLVSLFESDAGDSSDLLLGMLEPLPLDSLSWAGQAFQTKAAGILSGRIPGWSPSFLFRQSRDGTLELSVSFQAMHPVIVAYSPRIRSGTLPRILQSEISDDALETFSSFIGLPSEWVRRHAVTIEKLAAGSLESKWAARETRGKVIVAITPDRVAPVDIRVESDRYTLKGWVAASIGSDERHPELGVFLGRRTSPFKGWELELFMELLARTNDLSIENRMGCRWSAWPDIWFGAEWVNPEGEPWYRVWFEEILPKVYLWGRFNEEGDSNAALGWRFGEYLSGELYYDSRDGDGVRLRIIGNL